MLPTYRIAYICCSIKALIVPEILNYWRYHKIIFVGFGYAIQDRCNEENICIYNFFSYASYNNLSNFATPIGSS